MFTLKAVQKFKKPVTITHDQEHSIVKVLVHNINQDTNACEVHIPLDSDIKSLLERHSSSVLNKPIRPRVIKEGSSKEESFVLVNSMYRNMMAEMESHNRILQVIKEGYDTLIIMREGEENENSGNN